MVVSLWDHTWYNEIKGDFNTPVEDQTIIKWFLKNVSLISLNLVVCVVCAGLLNECAQVGETHYGDRLVIKISLHPQKRKKERMKKKERISPSAYKHGFRNLGRE